MREVPRDLRKFLFPGTDNIGSGRYRTNLPPEVLAEALRTGTMPTDFMAHIDTLLDEAPMSMLARVVGQIHADDGMPPDELWSNMRSLARSLKLTRELGPSST